MISDDMTLLQFLKKEELDPTGINVLI